MLLATVIVRDAEYQMADKKLNLPLSIVYILRGRTDESFDAQFGGKRHWKGVLILWI